MPTGRVEVAGDRHRYRYYRYLGLWGSSHWSRRRLYDGVEDLTGWDVLVVQMVRVARAARELQQLQPEEVRSWTSAPPFPARTTYIPMIGEDLARIRGLGNREWMVLQDRVLLVVHPDRDLDDDNGRLYGFAKLYSAPPGTPPPDPAGPTGGAGLDGAGGGGLLLPWLLHITRYELCERPCCAPLREPKPGGYPA